MQIEQHAHEVMAYLAELAKTSAASGRLRARRAQHLGRAQSKFADAEKRLDRFDGKLERAAEHESPRDRRGPLVEPLALEAA